MAELTGGELRDVLTGTLEAVKTQMVYVRNLHESFVLLYEALKKELPKLEETHRAEIAGRLLENSWQQSQIDAIDALLRRLM